MSIMPNKKVFEVADDYEMAASLCISNKIYLPASINAALAIEIYLKSFLSNEVMLDFFGPVKEISAERVNGHSLTSIYKKINPSLQEKILTLSSGKFELIKGLDAYDNFFASQRYNYELSSSSYMNDDLTQIASYLKEIVHSMYQENFA